MQLFYGTHIENNTIFLPEQESIHCVRVLRMKAGDPIDITDGNGNLYKGSIAVAHDKKTTVTIVSTSHQPALPYRLHLYVALTKHADRLEWMLEKCVEMGLASFTPLITQRTERKKIRRDRLESIVLSAMKQSLKAWLPVVHPLSHLDDAWQSIRTGEKLMAHCADDEKKISLQHISDKNELHVFIGPEGDFTPDETAAAYQQGFSFLSLGNSRLRTETAGLVVCSALYIAHTG